MIFDIAVNDRVRTVTVVRKGSVLHVETGGRVHIVDAVRVSASALSLLVGIEGGGRPAQSVDASFASRGTNGDFDVHIGGRTIPVAVRQPGSFGRQKKEGAAHGSGPQKVVAPMPGKIVRVLVKAGDEVKARQGLVVVEAMKMENELRAARDGRVREVVVGEGQSVDAGSLLLVVE